MTGGAEHPTELWPDPRRVVGRLFLPGEELSPGRSRAAQIAERVLAVPDDDVAQVVADIVADFEPRHRDLTAMLTRHAAAVASRVPDAAALGPERTLLLGAAFTAEYAVEAAALCNPSVVAHPDQNGLEPGQLRVAVALRAIGEGHISSIEFAEAVIGPGPRWAFSERTLPLAMASTTAGTWRREHLRAALEHEGHLDELSSAVLARLPEHFSAPAVVEAMQNIPEEPFGRHEGRAGRDALRDVASSAYVARFDEDTTLGQRVLLPTAADEMSGMEDARFVLAEDPDGRREYRATYTAYDGRTIAPRLIVSADLRTFAVHRLTGPAARNKGMALFPRQVGGMHLALTRSDGESISLARSAEGVVWDDEVVVHTPRQPWEVVQTGNCGSPLETSRGWLVLTHGVGPMRDYAIGAILLDRDEPTTVLARTEQPLLRARGSRRDGYVPNVVYSCGGILHEDRLWVPYGIGDDRIAVFCTDVEELLDSMEPSLEWSGQGCSRR